ncbi:hypothetical protein [Paenibacillus sp. ATY16]|uniref:hypothetical protein n=1 Tax=Paenibacillus sp. ATY16 TaxID=1759312 RepID=UPI00200C5491|nr:hypothetical protein [Paenibacillus sp. ATY16]MCK9862128.1 hypothetical protein [Paenibacillus sp. ATY16]
MIMLKTLLVSTIIFIGALIGCSDSGVAEAQSDPKSPYDPFIEPKTNINLMNEVFLFELSTRIERAVKDKFREIISESYEITGIRADGHGGYSVRVHGRIEHGKVVDDVNIYFDSPHFNSGLVFSRIEIKNINANDFVS